MKNVFMTIAILTGPAWAQADLHTFHCQVLNVQTENRFSAVGNFDVDSKNQATGNVTVTYTSQGLNKAATTESFTMSGTAANYAAGVLGPNESVAGTFELGGDVQNHLEVVLDSAKFSLSRLKLGMVTYRGSCGADLVEAPQH